MMSTATADVTSLARELNIGLTRESRQIEITQADIDTFAELSGDRNPIHVDRAVAQAAGLPDTIAHGALIFAKATGLAWELGLIVKSTTTFRKANLEFRKFVHPGDKISINIKVIEIMPMRGAGDNVVLDVLVLGNRREHIQRATWTALVRKPTA